MVIRTWLTSNIQAACTSVTSGPWSRVVLRVELENFPHMWFLSNGFLDCGKLWLEKGVNACACGFNGSVKRPLTASLRTSGDIRCTHTHTHTTCCSFMTTLTGTHTMFAANSAVSKLAVQPWKPIGWMIKRNRNREWAKLPLEFDWN